MPLKWVLALVRRRGTLLSAAATSFLVCGCSPRSVAPTVGIPSPTTALASPTAASAGPSLRFRDMAKGNLSYQWHVSGTRPLTILQTIGNGCAFLDYDGDGNLDILLVGPQVALYRGDGKGHFTDQSQAAGVAKLAGNFLGCAVGDYDNDGFPDVYLSGFRTGILLHNAAGKTFRDVTASSGIKPQPWGTSCTFVETVPGSGRLDLFVANYVDFVPGSPKSPQLCATRGVMTSCPPQYYGALKGTLFRNQGGGQFQDAGKSGGIASALSGRGLGVASAPLDASHRPFIAVANDEMSGDLLAPTADKKQYKNIAVEAGTAYNRDGNAHAGMGIDWGDFDNDGRFDLLVTTYQGEAKAMYHNGGDLQFDEVSGATGFAVVTRPMLSFGVKWADFDNDGWQDCIIASGHVQDNVEKVDPTATYRQATRVFHNLQGKRFADVSLGAGADLQKPIVGRGLAVGDYDNDGKTDALVVDSEGSPLLLHNETPDAGHFVSFSLVGSKSNRDGYGATVTLTANEQTQTHLCRSDGSYLSASDKRVPFGVGNANVISRVTVTWPSGKTDQQENVPVDRFYRIREGSKTLEVLSPTGASTNASQRTSPQEGQPISMVGKLP